MSVSSKEIYVPTSRNLDMVFTNDNKLKCSFRIPDFQRQYSWKNQNLDELWKDLIEAYKNSDEIYFLGSIVLVKEKNNSYSIIDGQQRLTTLVIMMDVLLKDFKSLLSSKMIKRLKKYHESNFKLQNNPSYDEEFEEEIRGQDTFNHTIDDLVSEKDLNNTDPRFKYRNTAYFFYDKFNNLEININDFLTFVFDHVFVIRTICYDENFAIKMFISLNDRGLPLSNADNFKSWLYSKCKKDQRDSFNIKWKKLVDTSNDLKFTMDDFIVWYEYYLIRQNPKMNVVDVLKDQLDEYDNPTIMKKLIEFMNCVKKIYNPTENTNLIYSLRYIKWKAYVMSILASAYVENYSPMTDLLKLLRKFYYVAWISGGNVNSVKQTSFNILDAVCKNKSIDDIEDYVNNFIYRKNRLSNLYSNINSNVYDTDYFKPLLLSVEYQEWEDNSLSFQQLDNKLHIDHILPKGYERDKNNEWEYIKNHDVVSQKINTLGNMALLQWYKNEKALNKGFKKKLNNYDGYEDDGINPIKDEKGKGATKFRTTQVIINEYKNTRKKWTTSSIDNRKIYLLNKIENMLDIKSDDVSINFDLEDNKIGKGKWKYKDSIYNNKMFIKNLLIDYIVSNGIKSSDKIPDDLKNFKIYHRDFITTKEDFHDRYLLEMNGMKLYICNVYYSSETPLLIDVFKKYYNFEYERIVKE